MGFLLVCFLIADVAVMNSATLKDLKLLIKKKVNEMEQANMGHRHISW
jgi:U11/U12 small nuclear ribonucleoprotein SNRNP25